MDFAQYKVWQAEVLSERIPARFDCLNPFAAMDSFRKWRNPGGAGDPVRAFEDWSKVHGVALAGVGAVPTRGVRSALGHLFEAASNRGMELVLPSDVYPFYIEEARRRAPSTPVKTFPTWGTPLGTAWPEVGRSAVLLVPQPWNTFGRILAPDERAALAAWAAGGDDRWIVLDMVYLYASTVNPSLWAGLPLDRTIPLLSMSKSWLVRGVFGGALDLTGRGGWWSDGLPGPSEEASALAGAALQQDPSFPERQRRVFEREWTRRAHLLDGIPQWPRGPGQGYFRPLKADARRLLEERNILTVPASVFGHVGWDGAVATCLFEAGDRPFP